MSIMIVNVTAYAAAALEGAAQYLCLDLHSLAHLMPSVAHPNSRYASQSRQMILHGLRMGEGVSELYKK